MTEQQKGLVDVIAKMIDVPMTEEARKFPDVYRAMTQVPWNVARALALSLAQLHPELITWREKWPDSEQIFKDEHDEDYAPGRRFQAVEWDFKTGSPLPTILQDTTKERPRLGDRLQPKGLQLKDFYKGHRVLFEKGTDGYDTHYAERQFLERVFYPAFGRKGLSLIKPQFGFKDAEGRQRHADFVIEKGAAKYAFEIEGSGFHAVGRISTEKHVDDVNRQNALTAQGYKVLRLAAAEVLNEPAVLTGGLKDKLKDLLLADDKLRAILTGPPEYGEADAEETLSLERALLHLYQFPLLFRPLQLALLQLLVTQRENLAEGPVVILDRSPVGALTAIALHELLNLLYRTECLYGITLDLPTRYRVVPGEPAGPSADGMWREYVETLENGLDEPCPYQVDFRSQPMSEEEKTKAVAAVEVNLSESAESSNPCVATGRSLSLTSLSRFLRALRMPRNRLHPHNWRKRTLDYFVRRLFGIPALRSTPNSKQWELLTKVVKDGKDALAIMPTGSGKSLCFQLPAMILPGGVLVVCPLRSLMRDQVSNLRSFGINCADYAASDVPTAQKDQNLRDFLEGKLSLIYVSPERIQIRSFLQNMHARAPTLNISLVAIDEAHCISEWGHDFRPSYLRVPRFVTETLKSGDSRPPILAITATASPPVLRDVRTILGIDDPQDVLEAESLDRRNLSFSVHFCPTDGSRAERLPEVLREIVPRVLKKQPFELFGRADDYRDAGVVFAVYANPHGRTTYRDGVGAIWDNLTQAGVVEPELAKLHSSGVPEKCPDCGQYTFRSVPANSSDEDQGRYLCEMCGHQFDRADRLQDREWDELVRGNQDSFKRNWFPLMVATKGYGMGVDKRNIRYIVHQGFSSSLEAYYQEAGRAGRDDEHAHCAIVCHPAHIDCERVHLNRLGPRDESPYPKCCEGKDLNRRTCPYGLPELCDFGAQANFLRHSYPKVETVLAKVMEIWDALMKKPSREVQIPHGNSEEEKNANERALYRLWTLGLIDDYTIDYSGGLSNSKMVVELTRFVGVVGSSPLSR